MGSRNPRVDAYITTAPPFARPISMAAFKAHCGLRFWKGSLVVAEPRDGALGQLGPISSLDDLPPKRTLLALIRKAARLNQAGISAASARSKSSAASTRGNAG